MIEDVLFGQNVRISCHFGDNKLVRTSHIKKILSNPILVFKGLEVSQTGKLDEILRKIPAFCVDKMGIGLPWLMDIVLLVFVSTLELEIEIKGQMITRKMSCYLFMLCLCYGAD